MRILIKGGVWKNTEDEILKAAVMKYGKNQWARVASLLSRKSAKQCKARWYEWLDPSIKKTDWTREEEEKLLHLAKLMPNQWRTIAPIVGRTAGQCMEHYERLLDQAQDGEENEGDAAATGSEEARRLRPGEIDPTPETKPARPDPIDMDEDEKEMLSEARARLANTKGKKAKRKARERMLEDSRRLAMLQKRRELKAAGIESKLGGGGNKRKYVDYAREIPFQKLAPTGFYDVSEENEQAKGLTLDPKKQGLELSKLEGRHEKEENERQQARDKKLMKELFKANAPLAVSKISEQTDPVSLRRRLPLDLPAPQVTESELEEVVKLGKAAVMGPPEGLPGNFSATNALVNDYSQVFKPPATPLRTPVQEDIVMQEARNLRALSKMTPLMMHEQGQELPELYAGTGFDGVAPRRANLATPNVVLGQQTPLHTASHTGSMSVLSTPARGGTMHATSSLAGGSVAGSVMRDSFGLNHSNQAQDDNFSVSDVSTILTHSRSDKHRSKLLQQQLLAQLQALPEPEYTYEVAAPRGVDAMDVEGDEEDVMLRKPEDAAEVEARLQRQREEVLQAELARRSRVLKRDFPRPVLITTDILSVAANAQSQEPHAASSGPKNKRPRKGEKEETIDAVAVDPLVSARKLLAEEMLHILAFEDRKYPPEFSAGQLLQEARSSLTSSSSAVPARYKRDLEVFEDVDLQAAERLINAELAQSHRSSAHSLEDKVAETVGALTQLHQRLIYVPGADASSTMSGTFTTSPSSKEQLQALKSEFGYLAAHFDHDRQRVGKLQAKIQRQTQGYLQRSRQLLQTIQNTQVSYSKASSDLEGVQAVREQERLAAQHRLDRGLEDAIAAEALERESQQLYAALVSYARSRGISL